MIPAILSCIFVIYLYQTLNHPTSSDGSSVDEAARFTSTDLTDSLSARMDRIQRRLDKLSKGGDS